MSISKMFRILLFVVAIILLSLRFFNVIIPNTKNLNLILEIILQSSILIFLYYILFNLGSKEEKERKKNNDF